ncbi:lipopolysaccharide biosynthesis protein [Lactococcus lactis]|uniref:lipopolysaccharide biosynthesis protein n=1 Tax=Lactococcus lactis TaxID=1358 RepID=UPI00288EBFE2|nr:lipopolysaccharide biosynthesis protein [Lactococcus lactis]MDT2926289.1 lipopolysaccharide biosynthesis protein [Lactococcus lactis]
MNKYKKRLSNSLVFTIGNLGSKLLVFLLVPLYTYAMIPQEYGMADLYQTTASLLLPLITMNVFDATLRFAMEKSMTKEIVLTNSLVVWCFSAVFSCFGMIFVYALNLSNKWYLALLFLIILFQGGQSILSQYARGIGKSKLFAAGGVILTFLTGALNIFFLVFLHAGITGYLMSLVLANLGTILFFAGTLSIWQAINFKVIDKEMIWQMLYYALPLIPNAIMWWSLNASNRYFVLFFLGAGANGLLAVATKIPSIISIFNTIFTQAWQISAIEEYNSYQKSKYYSDVFHYLATFLLLGTSAFMIVLKPVVEKVVSSDYASSWQYVPFFMLAMLFSSFSGFFGTNYIAAKQTKGVFMTSIYGAIVCILLQVVLLPTIGLNGAGLASMLGFLTTFLLRVKDTQKFVAIQIKWRIFISNFIDRFGTNFMFVLSTE